MQSILLFTRFDKKNLYEKMPPQNETALVLFKLGLQNIRKLFHIANGIVLFPERAVVSQYRLFSPHKRDSDYGCPCRCCFSCSFDRHKTLAPDNHEPRFLEIFRIEKFAAEADNIAVVFLFRLTLCLGGDQNARRVFQLRWGNVLRLRKRAVRRDFDIASAGCQNQIDIFVRKRAPLIVQYNVGVSRAKKVVQLLVIAVSDRHLHIRMLFGKQLQCAMEFYLRVTTQIPDFKLFLIAAGDFCGFDAHPLVIGSQKETFLIKIFACRS